MCRSRDRTALPLRAHVVDYLELLQASEWLLAKAFEKMRATYADGPDIGAFCRVLAEWSNASADAMESFVEQYGERRETSRSASTTPCCNTECIAVKVEVSRVPG